MAEKKTLDISKSTLLFRTVVSSYAKSPSPTAEFCAHMWPPCEMRVRHSIDAVHTHSFLGNSYVAEITPKTPHFSIYLSAFRSYTNVLTFNRSLIENRIISICDYLNLEKNFDSFLNWILDLRKELNIPHKLSDVIESSKIDIDKLSKMALEDPSTSTNPKKMTIDDMKILYDYSISGKLF